MIVRVVPAMLAPYSYRVLPTVWASTSVCHPSPPVRWPAAAGAIAIAALRGAPRGW